VGMGLGGVGLEWVGMGGDGWGFDYDKTYSGRAEKWTSARPCTQGNAGVKQNIATVFGAKTVTAMEPVEADLEGGCGCHLSGMGAYPFGPRGFLHWSSTCQLST